MQRLKTDRRRRPAPAIIGASVALALIAVNGMILSEMKPRGADAPIDYLIVLGARLHDGAAGTALQTRIDRAAEYLLENLDIIAVLSGGSPYGGEITEAEYMHRALREKGIHADRLILEPTASDTEENLLRSLALIPEGASFGVLSNDFHLFRTRRLLKRLGYHGTLLSAPYPKKKLPLMLLRENVAVVCSFFMGKL